MEEEKAAAYCEELTRKGLGAARFKQGLGVSSTSAGDAPERGSALVSSSSSFLSSFVRASSPKKVSEAEKQYRLESIQSKLSKKKVAKPRSPERRGARSRRSRSRERGDEREREFCSRRRSRSRSRERRRDGDRRRWRSRSRSDSGGDKRRREGGRNRSPSPGDRNHDRRNQIRSSSPLRDRKLEKKSGSVDYSKLIDGYDKMSQAERVKAKMKLQLAKTVEKDETKGSAGWERFEFNKDAPLDEEEIPVAEDDASLVKHIGQSFRFSAVQEKREQKVRDAHEEAMFGVPETATSLAKTDKKIDCEDDTENCKKEINESDAASSLLSEKVLAKQQGSWRDRARKLKD